MPTIRTSLVSWSCFSSYSCHLMGKPKITSNSSSTCFLALAACSFQLQLLVQLFLPLQTLVSLPCHCNYNLSIHCNSKTEIHPMANSDTGIKHTVPEKSKNVRKNKKLTSRAALFSERCNLSSPFSLTVLSSAIRKQPSYMQPHWDEGTLPRYLQGWYSSSPLKAGVLLPVLLSVWALFIFFPLYVSLFPLKAKQNKPQTQKTTLSK